MPSARHVFPFFFVLFFAFFHLIADSLVTKKPETKNASASSSMNKVLSQHSDSDMAFSLRRLAKQNPGLDDSAGLETKLDVRSSHAKLVLRLFRKMFADFACPEA